MGILEKLFKDSNPRRLPPPSYSNEAVLARIEKQEGVGRDTARAWFGEMLIFLDLCARSDKILSPPPDVDKAWHAFLLHSHDYEAYCRDRFGKVIHHQPSGEPDPAAYRRAYDRRQDYGTTTGVGDPLLWTVPANGASEGEDSDDAGARGTASTGTPGGGPYGGGYSDDSSGDRGSDGAGGGDSGGSGGGDSGASGGGDSGASGGGDSGGSSCGGGGCGGGGS